MHKKKTMDNEINVSPLCHILISSSSSGVVTQWPKSEGDISAPVLSEPVAIGDGVVIIPLQERGTRGSRAERQPLAPVQSSQKRKRDRPSLDGEDEDTVSHTDMN